MADDRNTAGAPKDAFNEAANQAANEQERDEGSQMVRDDGFRHDMHPPAEIRAPVDRQSYNARLASEFENMRDQEFDEDRFLDELEIEESAEAEPVHARAAQHESEPGGFDEDRFLEELENEESAETATVHELTENQGSARGEFDEDQFFAELESEEEAEPTLTHAFQNEAEHGSFDEDQFLDDLEQDAGEEEAEQDHWDDFDYETYVSAADEADAKDRVAAELPTYSDPLPGERSLSEEFNQVDDDFDWRSYVSAADELEAREAEPTAPDGGEFDEDKFLEDIENNEEFDRGYVNSSDYDHDNDM